MSFRARCTTILALALLSPSFARAQGRQLPRVSRLGVPDTNWMLEIPTEGFVLQNTQIADDGFETMMMATNKTNDMVMSVYLEKASRRLNIGT